MDARRNYPIAVLRLALERSGVAHVLEPSSLQASQTRAMLMVRAGGLDVMWTVPTADRMRQLRMVPFPIDRGLIGWRVLLVHRDTSTRYASMSDVDALAPLVGVQGADWPDLETLRANGLHVAAGASYDSLFRMLALKHVDYFPRGVGEAGGEVAARPRMPIQVAPGVALHYPSALCFFVAPDNRALADALQAGLEAAHRDGSLQRLFNETQGELLDRLAMDTRHVIELHNPDFPAHALAPQRSDLWYRPAANP